MLLHWWCLIYLYERAQQEFENCVRDTYMTCVWYVVQVVHVILILYAYCTAVLYIHDTCVHVPHTTRYYIHVLQLIHFTYAYYVVVIVHNPVT